MNYVFDAMGTLFDLAPLRERLGPPATEAWFERLLHSAATLTVVGEFAPFAELARTTLATTCAKLAIDVDQEDVLAQLRCLPPAEGARAALEKAGRAFVLTNGGREGGEALLRNAGLDLSSSASSASTRCTPTSPTPAPTGSCSRPWARRRSSRPTPGTSSAPSAPGCTRSG